MTEHRLPTVNADDGAWGDILNQFIAKEHYNTGLDDVLNGSHNTVTIMPGTTSAGTAPLKFNSGPLMLASEAGAIEFLSDSLYFTQTTGSIRKAIATYDSSGSTGGIHFVDSDGNFTNLAIGSLNQVLTVVGGLPQWETLPTPTVLAVSTNITASSATTHIIDASSGPLTIALPAATVKQDAYYNFKKIDSTANPITIIPDGLDTIDGNPNIVIEYKNSAIDLVSNGYAWYII